MRKMPARWLAALVSTTAVGACIVVAHSTRGVPFAPGRGVVLSPVRAYLLDGSIVVYRRGVTVTRDSVRGTGVRYSATLRDSLPVTFVPLDSVVGMDGGRL